MAPSPSSMLYSEPYIPLKLVAFAAKNHPVAKKKELALSDLEHVPLIVRMDNDLQSTTHTVLSALRKQGYKLNIAMRCESPEAVQSAVTQNLGIGLLYYHAVKAAIERGSFKTIQIRGLEIETPTYIVYSKERPLSPHAEEFLSCSGIGVTIKPRKRPKPSLNTHVGARFNVASCRTFAASALL